MKEHAVCDGAERVEEPEPSGLETLLDAPMRPRGTRPGTGIGGAVVGTLVAFAEGGAVPLVVYPGLPGTAAAPARATVDLHGAHVGRGVVLLFEDGDPSRPIVVGCLREAAPRPADAAPGQMHVDVDGERLVVSAGEQLVLRCGKASITLTKAGKVLVQGAYVSSRSSGVLRLKGGAVQIN